ncbi:ATP-dependent RNA helicase ded1 [Scaptodrosophila lebanonensis]|uniref:ATP-dependent RNA helicase ded1 n=1 Tax=Drosophila lebanonensis TaxID=7225 RepID=A0A6J2T424_DROLE|nr:ATP-dependent RNA helicase ded1 [Scaptodrosophila lebanonensis]
MRTFFVYFLLVLSAVAVLAEAVADEQQQLKQLTLEDVDEVGGQQENSEVREPRQFGFRRFGGGFGRGFGPGFGPGFYGGGFRRPYYGGGFGRSFYGGGFRRPYYGFYG